MMRDSSSNCGLLVPTLASRDFEILFKLFDLSTVCICHPIDKCRAAPKPQFVEHTDARRRATRTYWRSRSCSSSASRSAIVDLSISRVLSSNLSIYCCTRSRSFSISSRSLEPISSNPVIRRSKLDLFLKAFAVFQSFEVWGPV